jgi:hypothetical protein
VYKGGRGGEGGGGAIIGDPKGCDWNFQVLLICLSCDNLVVILV